MKWLAALFPILVVVLIMALWLGRQESGPPPTAKPRTAGAVFCPKVLLGPQAGLPIADRQLRNLGEGLMGETVTYRVGEGIFEIHVGFEAFEALEDLDFTPQGIVSLGGRRFELSKAAGVPKPLWAATFDLGRGPEGCREVTLIGDNVEGGRFRTLLAALEG
jgi:hypothetical protein